MHSNSCGESNASSNYNKANGTKSVYRAVIVKWVLLYSGWVCIFFKAWTNQFVFLAQYAHSKLNMLLPSKLKSGEERDKHNSFHMPACSYCSDLVYTHLTYLGF